jgi:UDP-sugar pyrophosphorylase
VNWGIFTPAEQAIATVLVTAGQSHLFSGWPEPGNFDEDKKRLMAQAIDLEKKCPGGIEGYCSRARDLLEASRKGTNPYQGFKPSVPLGQNLETQTAEGRAEFDRLEAKGMSEMAGTAYVLVAGGLGERLGYDGIKVELPAEITTETCYLDLYCQHILALQARARIAAGDDSITLPLAIMTSGDTDEWTRELLEANANFGMAEGQLTIVMQELVPALLDNAAHMATSEDDPFLIETKPHGHGDVHLLLHQSGLASKWAAGGVKWVLFFQDTNGLGSHTRTDTHITPYHPSATSEPSPCCLLATICHSLSTLDLYTPHLTLPYLPQCSAPRPPPSESQRRRIWP